MLHRIAQNRYLGLFSGLILLATAGYETWRTVDEFALGAHHGLLAYSLTHILRSLPDLREGVQTIAEARVEG